MIGYGVCGLVLFLLIIPGLLGWQIHKAHEDLVHIGSYKDPSRCVWIP